MKILKAMTSLAALTLLVACGSEESASGQAVQEQVEVQVQVPEQNEVLEQVQEQVEEQVRGVLTTTQEQALKAANSVEQTLLDAAQEQEDELKNRLQRN